MSKDDTIKKKQELVKNYQTLFSSPMGKEVLLDILKSCEFHKPSFDSDTHLMAYNEGRRSVALGLVRTLKMDLKQFQLMLEKSYSGE